MLEVELVIGSAAVQPELFVCASTPQRCGNRSREVALGRISMIQMILVCVMTLSVTVALEPRLAAQVPTEVPLVVPGAKPVTVEHIKIHGTALEGNLEGDAVDRDVIVFLPPSYAKEKHRRYPVVYALHGFSIGAEQWTDEIHLPQTPVILLYDLRIPVRT